MVFYICPINNNCLLTFKEKNFNSIKVFLKKVFDI